jgi:hypothetical protein
MRIQNPAKMRRLRSLGNVVLEWVSKGFAGRAILEALSDETQEGVFLQNATNTEEINERCIGSHFTAIP